MQTRVGLRSEEDDVLIGLVINTSECSVSASALAIQADVVAAALFVNEQEEKHHANPQATR